MAATRRDKSRREGCASERGDPRGHREGIAPSGGLMERYSGAPRTDGGARISLCFSLSPRASLLCNLLAATSPRSSLPLAVSARGQRAHAPPSADTLVLRGKKEKRWCPASILRSFDPPRIPRAPSDSVTGPRPSTDRWEAGPRWSRWCPASGAAGSATEIEARSDRAVREHSVRFRAHRGAREGNSRRTGAASRA